jgi:hypothetical protein
VARRDGLPWWDVLSRFGACYMISIIDISIYVRRCRHDFPGRTLRSSFTRCALLTLHGGTRLSSTPDAMRRAAGKQVR